MVEPYLSVVLPFRDQADHVAKVVESYLAPLEGTGRTFEIVSVPNACADATQSLLEDVARKEPRVRVASNPNGGWGRSVLCGLAAARGTVLCYSNSARTEPSTVVELLALYERHAPCLAKVRRVRRGAIKRELGSWLYNLEGRTLFGFSLSDVNGTPKIFPRELYEAMELRSEDDLLDLELCARCHARGVPMVELDVPGFRRHGGRSRTNWRSAWAMYVGAVGLRNRLRAEEPGRGSGS